MAIGRFEPCLHGNEKSSCPLCEFEVKLAYLEDRVGDLEKFVYHEPEHDVQEKTDVKDS